MFLSDWFIQELSAQITNIEIYNILLLLSKKWNKYIRDNKYSIVKQCMIEYTYKHRESYDLLNYYNQRMMHGLSYLGGFYFQWNRGILTTAPYHPKYPSYIMNAYDSEGNLYVYGLTGSDDEMYCYDDDHMSVYISPNVPNIAYLLNMGELIERIDLTKGTHIPTSIRKILKLLKHRDSRFIY